MPDPTIELDDLFLPKILLGPILRRAEETQVCIWLACDRPVTVKAEIFRFEAIKANNKGSNQNSHLTGPIGSGISKSRRLGEHLHVILAVARPIELQRNETSASDVAYFPSDELLAYDIEFIFDNDSKNTSVRLKDLGLVNGKNSIVYGHSKGVLLPTFFLRRRNTPLNFLHGSCRKLHGKGEDCLVAADEIIYSSFTDLKMRPSALFLTGDQIYADDVASPLSQYLTQLGIKLVGGEEQILGIGKKLTE
ncbi:MAG TPA: hypothetical protein VGE97_03005, partial [Nitrososphaera sp.]